MRLRVAMYTERLLGGFVPSVVEEERGRSRKMTSLMPLGLDAVLIERHTKPDAVDGVNAGPPQRLRLVGIVGQQSDVWDVQ